MTTVVVAEKPSVARDIARVLGAAGRAEGYLEGHGYRVTWAVGHLIHFAEPDDYGPPWKGRWSLTQLPMVPTDWRLKTTPATAKQFRIVRELINAGDCSEIVCATDAGREGEHIFRLIYEHARCRKPVRRLWVSSLTDEAIRDGFRRLRPGSDYDDLGRAARARAQSDWLVGMNLTRAYTVHNRVLCPIGRVQTPTLAMIVARDAVIEGFVKALFYELVARLAEGFSARYSREGETRIDDKAQAERLQARLKPHRAGTVTGTDKRLVHNRPPPFYDLTTLQRDANRRFGLTAAQVLEQAQALYETHKLISYPRTESRHISEDMLAQLPGILSRLDHPQAAEALARLNAGHRLGKAYVDSTKLTDHHAIIPTGKRAPVGLAGPARRVYELVEARFVGVFLPEQVVEETLVTLNIGGETFVARGSLVLEEGWKRVEPGLGVGPSEGAADGAERAAAPLPPLTVGQTVHVEALDVVEKETQPPRPFTDATLLAAMKGAGRDIEDEALARALKGCGLGTPATRAEIIEKLIRTGYVERERKQLRATPKGRALIALVAEPLRSPGLTAAWEQQLKEVEEGTREVAAFYRDIVAFVSGLVPRIAAGPAMTAEQLAAAQSSGARTGGREPRGRAKAARGKARRSRAGQDDASAAEASREFGGPRPAGLGPCPLCGADLLETPRAFGCGRYREGCGFVVWKENHGVTLSRSQVGRLVKLGVTERIEGFRSGSGAVFAARLKLGDGGKVELDASDAPNAAGASPQSGRNNAAPNAADQAAAPPRARVRAAANPPSLTCPRCGLGHIIEGRRGFGCDRYREGCTFVVWKEVGGKSLTQAQLRDLVQKGLTRPIKGLVDAAGEYFDARLRLDGDRQVVVERLAKGD
jgi:DNA topoisomerase III